MKLRFFLAILFLMLGLCVGQTQADEISSYMFDDGTVDDSVGSADGIIVNDAVVIPDPTGSERGQILSLDGEDDAVDIPAVTSLQSLGECTVALWVRLNVAPGDLPNNAACGFRADVWNNGNIGIIVKKDTGLVEFSVANSFDYTHPADDTIVSTTALVANTWYHLAGTYKSGTTNGGVLYVNGVPEGTKNTKANLADLSHTSGAMMGAYDNTGTGNTNMDWNGYIDEVRLFDHVLSQEEIAALMAPPDPYANAGADKSTILPTNTVTLAGGVSDNGDPNHVLSYWWDEVGKPAGATISLNPNNMGFANRATIAIPGADPNGTVVDPVATMDLAGIYELALTAWDDENDTNDTVQIWVYPADYLGLVALWELEQNANADAAGKFYVPNESTRVFDELDTPGTLVGDPNWTDGPDYNNTALLESPTDFGYAITLDHEQEECVAIQNLYYDSDDNEELTVCAWIKTVSGSNQVIASFDRGEYWRLAVNSDDAGAGQVGFGINTNTGVVGVGSSRIVNELNEVTGEPDWHHVAVVFDNGDLSLYLDGVLDASNTGGTKFGSGNVRYGFIGVGSEAETANGAKGPEDYFNGDIDDVRIYNVALTQSEVLTAAGIVNGPPVADAGPDLRLIHETEGDSINMSGASVIDVPGDVELDWSQVSGPGTVTLPTPGTYDDDPNITVTFDGSSFGLYELKLTATDAVVGTWTSEDTMFIMYQEKAQYSTSRATPLAHWKLDESSGTTAADSSGNGFDGTVKSLDEVDPNLPLFDDDGGKIDGALDFINFGDDTGQYVDLRNTPGSDNLTAMFWMKADALAHMVPLDKFPVGSGGGGWNVKLRADGRIWFQVGSTGVNDSVRPSVDDASYAVGEWVHLAFTYDADTNTIAEYVNGLRVSNKESTNENIGTNNVGTLLQMATPSEATTSEQFQGLLDHVRIYDIALSPIDVALQAIADTVTMDGCQTANIEGQEISQDISGPDGVPDCYVNLFDLAEIASGWLECTDLNNSSCW